MLLVLLFFIACGASTGLPRLNLAPTATVSGISSGADFAVQFFTAFSSQISGMAVFAGEAFGCAVIKMPTENLTSCISQPPVDQGPGCVSGDGQSPATCIGCPFGKTIRYDHCKNEPEIVSLGILRSRVDYLAQIGLIDHPKNMINSRIFLYRGIKDAIYLGNSVSVVGEMLSPWLANATDQIEYISNISSTHAWPTQSFGSPCGFPSPEFPPAIQDCNYDGSGESLQFLYLNALIPPPANSSSRGEMPLIKFNQTEYLTKEFSGLASHGYLYVPQKCMNGSLCKLIISFHGCTMYALNPEMGTNFTNTGYNAWADANDFVVVYPQNGGYVEFKDQYKTTSFQQATGCWDSYGQTGPHYNTKRGLQMASIANMVRALGLDLE